MSSNAVADSIALPMGYWYWLNVINNANQVNTSHLITWKQVAYAYLQKKEE